ncbi:hypothetical protein ASC97_27295 [Rhizobium sp. Root1203]|uniref:hypothetical protein n=1 Tax=Rhizobium sp. Root1203 TaxID=1736427 RepID=UPI000709960E|nr:hypothetical protein [Rhizobium sp. Root1203]KQV22734.1 hypothetical protein ASC97_27295 [Rhizobium sp. Root1203]
MSASSESDRAGEGRNERSAEDLTELVALARLIAYAKCAAQDIEIVSAMHWLDMAIQAVNREILDVPNAGITIPTLSAVATSRNTH